jgi:hypothetical protein
MNKLKLMGFCGVFVIKQYLYNIFHALSQLLSAITGGSPKESTSQRTARASASLKNKAGFKSSWFIYQEKTIDFIFLVLAGEENHCKNSLVGETNTKEIWNWDT